ncbi:MAG: type II and III secretion system protein family protein [Acidobacteriota bacterium]|nr:type II and III secretion system protein family protein [Acidobacteriota bacterium]
MIYANSRTENRHSASCRRCLILLLFAASLSQARAQRAISSNLLLGATSVPLTVHTADARDVLHITVGRSIVFTSGAPLHRVYVGNPSVLQTFTSGSTEIVLTAKSSGVSSLVIWDEAGCNRLYSVFADIDPESLRDSLAQAFPGSSIHVEAGEGKIFLSGSVASAVDSEAAHKMASLYAKEVVNSLRILPSHGKQVQLKLRIIEVDRSRLEQLGINLFTSGNNTAAATTTSQFTSVATGVGSALAVSNPLNVFLYSSSLNAGVTVQDLEQKHVLQVLAEPTLTTLSGLPARFLSGGEFPFPVVEGGTGNTAVVTIQFRPYGVKVDFTPTVNVDGSIRLKLAPEVSTLDYSNAVTISGFTIPALSTRRAETEVEIRDGQSFVVSGLLDHRTTEIMSKVPGIANIPIIGQLFRSKNFNHSVTELVIMVTATIVDPLAPNAGPAPAEPKFVVPNLDADAFDASARSKSNKSNKRAAEATELQIQPATKGPGVQ